VANNLADKFNAMGKADHQWATATAETGPWIEGER
jgi:hypothetical protein